jgi:ABC-type lipoprotein release transport system permease subunit
VVVRPREALLLEQRNVCLTECGLLGALLGLQLGVVLYFAFNFALFCFVVFVGPGQIFACTSPLPCEM